MWIAPIVLFAIAALGGVTLAGMRLTSRPLPMALALGHGLFAVTALILLIVAVVGAAAVATLISAALILFIVAAIGGIILFSFHLRGQALPVPLVLIHGLAAVVAFVLLLVGVLG